MHFKNLASQVLQDDHFTGGGGGSEGVQPGQESGGLNMARGAVRREAAPE